MIYYAANYFRCHIVCWAVKRNSGDWMPLVPFINFLPISFLYLACAMSLLYDAVFLNLTFVLTGRFIQSRVKRSGV